MKPGSVSRAGRIDNGSNLTRLILYLVQWMNWRPDGKQSRLCQNDIEVTSNKSTALMSGTFVTFPSKLRAARRRSNLRTPGTEAGRGHLPLFPGPDRG